MLSTLSIAAKLFKSGKTIVEKNVILVNAQSKKQTKLQLTYISALATYSCSVKFFVLPKCAGVDTLNYHIIVKRIQYQNEFLFKKVCLLKSFLLTEHSFHGSYYSAAFIFRDLALTS